MRTWYNVQFVCERDADERQKCKIRRHTQLHCAEWCSGEMHSFHIEVRTLLWQRKSTTLNRFCIIIIIIIANKHISIVRELLCAIPNVECFFPLIATYVQTLADTRSGLQMTWKRARNRQKYRRRGRPKSERQMAIHFSCE